MKKLIIASLFLVIGTSLITLAQESTSFKKFNYGVRLISEFDFLPTFYIPKNNNPTYEINMKPESYINYGLGFNMYFNINKMFFLKFGIENGVDLGEMNRVLLQKIEELTLIIIEQDKVLNEQNERINKLELQQNN